MCGADRAGLESRHQTASEGALEVKWEERSESSHQSSVRTTHPQMTPNESHPCIIHLP